MRSGTDTPGWQRAAAFAARAHQGQMRKDGRTPYVAHTFRVAMTVRDLFGCEDGVALCAALLHDTIEDTATDFDDIERSFGRAVADAVAAMSKNMLLPEQERERDYDRRLASGPWQSRLIKLADVHDNGCDLIPGTDGTKNIERCERALALSSGDTGACFDRAREIVGRTVAMLRERAGG